MKNIISGLLFSLILVIFCNTVHSQSLDSALARYGEKYQQEKAYLHLDKSSYLPGETVWFKAYLMEGIFPANQSKTLYVDWIAENGAVLLHSVSPLVDAVTNGQFDIPQTYTGNFVHVRAYTKWMLNFDTAFLFNKDIRIFNKNTSAKTSRPPAIVSTLRFFPEGGDMIAGVNNKIAFKANDQYGRPVKIKGVILDQKGGFVDSLKIIHDGMGTFHLAPQEGATYTAKWKDEKGSSFNTDLPLIKPTGVSLQIGMNNGKRIISILSSANLGDELKTIHVIGVMNNKMAFKTNIEVKPNGIASKVLPVESLPSGIITITAFDGNWNAIAERVCFIKNEDYRFQPSMEVKYWGLGRRKRNEIEITVPENLGAASLSVSVTDAEIERDTTDNIISHFLLSSEIRGRVHNPAYYFSNNSETVMQELDLVMLTNGWRKFEWKDISQGKMPAITYPRDTNYLALSGKVFGVAKTQLSGTESIVLMIKEKDSGSRMIIVPINRDATFSDQDIVLFDSVRVYYSLKSKFLGQAEARFMTERLPAPNYVTYSRSFLSNPFFDTTGIGRHINLATAALDLSNQQNKMMETVTVRAKQKAPVQVMDEKYTSGMFSGGDGYQFDLVNDPFASSSLSIFTYLQGKVAGLQITTGAGTPSLTWRGGSPVIFIDEMQSDPEMVSGIPVNDIAYIKVFRPPFMGSSSGGSGAIAIYTKRGDEAKDTRSGGMSSNVVVGYTQIKQFYSPNYERYDARNENKDLRTTLYWNPQVISGGKKNTIRLSFFNNDISNSFRVVIEGMTQEGLLTHYEEIME
jgi:hypothetical protein